MKLSQMPPAEAHRLIAEAIAELHAEEDAEYAAKARADLAAYEAKKRVADAELSDAAAGKPADGQEASVGRKQSCPGRPQRGP